MSAISLIDFGNLNLEQIERLRAFAEDAMHKREEEIKSNFGPFFVAQVGARLIDSLPYVDLPSLTRGDSGYPLISKFNIEEMKGHTAARGVLADAKEGERIEQTRSFIAVRVDMFDEELKKLANTVVIIYRRYSTSGEMEDTYENMRYDTIAIPYNISSEDGTTYSATGSVLRETRLNSNDLKALGKLLKGETIEASHEHITLPESVKYARLYSEKA